MPMSTFKPKEADFERIKFGVETRRVLKKNIYDSFNPVLLGLGDIKQPAVATDAVAAMFDLEGFTTFSKKIEPHLSVPLFLSEFLEWLFAVIRDEMTESHHANGAVLYGPLPFFVKFMGDGLLVLFDVSKSCDTARRNIVLSARQVCRSYSTKFLPSIQARVVEPPSRLRCGVARGTVYSVGNGQDYVGSCINMTARLQKLPGLTFAFNRRGFNLED